jgi:hypothetical protein
LFWGPIAGWAASKDFSYWLRNCPDSKSDKKGIMIEPIGPLVYKLEYNIKKLEANLSDPLINELYEKADYWRALGQRAIQKDTRVNYPIRAKSELQIYGELRKRLLARKGAEYSEILDIAGELIKMIATIHPPKDGHLGILRILHREFDFLMGKYDFRVVDEQPTWIRFSSGKSYVHLEFANTPSLSCFFGPEGDEEQEFWIDDLLFLYNDDRYITLPQTLTFETEDDLDEWYKFLAEVFKKYGQEFLSGVPGIFERLVCAQQTRDSEYIRRMNEMHGNQEKP